MQHQQLDQAHLCDPELAFCSSPSLEAALGFLPQRSISWTHQPRQRNRKKNPEFRNCSFLSRWPWWEWGEVGSGKMGKVPITNQHPARGKVIFLLYACFFACEFKGLNEKPTLCPQRQGVYPLWLTLDLQHLAQCLGPGRASVKTVE